MYDHLAGHKPEIGDVWYRVDDPYRGDKFGPPRLTRFYVQRVTPCGVWLDVFPPRAVAVEIVANHRIGARFVLLPDVRTPDGGRRAAYPTVALARQSWLIRKSRQRQRLAAQTAQLERWERRIVSMGDAFWED